MLFSYPLHNQWQCQHECLHKPQQSQLVLLGSQPFEVLLCQTDKARKKKKRKGTFCLYTYANRQLELKLVIRPVRSSVYCFFWPLYICYLVLQVVHNRITYVHVLCFLCVFYTCLQRCCLNH